MRLNPQQALIVDHPSNVSALVIAGAGSGKTTVIAQRAVKLSASFSASQHLQMLTFSNKAAKEMRERVVRLGGADLEKIRFDTYHSFGLKSLMADPTGFGLTEGFTLLNETDCKRAIRALAHEAGFPKKPEGADKKKFDPVLWLSTWSLARQAGFDVNNDANKLELCNRLVAAHDLSEDEARLAFRVLGQYEKQKRKANSVDFDDLLYMPLLRLARDDAYRSERRVGLAHVIIDESQDTNRIQYEMVRYLALGHCAVTCVGDDDQSIYGWRGAEVSNLKRFVAHFKATEMRLEQNYRSTQNIVSAAGRLIANNADRLMKTPFSEGEMGEVPECSISAHSRDMADAIAQRIADRLTQGVPANEVAVLYRTNRMAMLLEQSFRRLKIPYHVVGGMSLFERAEVVAVTSALRLGVNPTDMFALKAIHPFIDRFGASSCYALCDWLKDNEGASLAALPESVEGVTDRGLQAFKTFFNELRYKAVLMQNVGDFVKWAIEGPMQLLEREKDAQLQEKRAQHIAMLVKDIEQELADRSVLEPHLTWRDLFLEVALRDARQTEGSAAQVTLSTLHRSKGLEWDEVHIAGFSEGLMPLDSRTELADDDAACGHVEEERRLAYVGLTRARKQCHLYHADQYGFPGAKEERIYEMSRFADELGARFNNNLSAHQELVSQAHTDDSDFMQHLKNQISSFGRLG